MKNVLLLFILMLSACSLSAQCVFTDAGKQADYEALMVLYNATDGPNWTDNTGWANGADSFTPDCAPCDNVPVAWKGVICSGGRVTRIRLGSNNLNGNIPEELSNLTNLTELLLNTNYLTGEIPSTLSSLLNLRILSLYENNLTGEIPSALGSLSNLEGLWLDENNLTGEIPSALGSLSNLTSLRLDDNYLTGEIPSALGSLLNLTGLWLDENRLTGEIPSALGSLSNLRSLDLSFNDLTGEIPSALGSLSNLTSLSLSRNDLMGEIPSALGSLSNLTSLSLYRNVLTGEIPSALGSLSNLRFLRLYDNNLAGCFPQSLCDLFSNGVSLYLHNNPGLPGGGSEAALEEFCITGSVGAETCGDGIDNNCDGLVDEGCCALVLDCKETYTVALPITGSITVQASELDDNSSGCGALAYAVNGSSSLTLGCGDIGAQEVTLDITDTEGNSDDCTVELVLEDHNPNADADNESDACDDAFSIDTKIASMIGYINGLGLTVGQANSLIRKLQHAFGKYCGGQSQVALNQLNAFVNEILSLEADGVLSPAAAAELIAGANAIIGAISSGAAIDGCPASGLAAPAGGSTSAASAVDLQLFPNPVRRQVHFTIQAPEDSPAQARVYGLNGQLLLTRSLSLNKGFNADYLEVASFQDGLYLLEVQFGEKRLQRRFVVQK